MMRGRLLSSWLLLLVVAGSAAAVDRSPASPLQLAAAQRPKPVDAEETGEPALPTTNERIARAAELAASRQWDAAVAEYRALVDGMPNNATVLKALAQLERWRGHLSEARALYARATQNPNDKEALLGHAATEVLDHDYEAADQLYERAWNRWPDDAEVLRAIDDFRTLRAPRVFAFYEDDLSFLTREFGTYVPLRSGDEIGAGYQSETRKDYVTGTESYMRRDYKAYFERVFSLDHSVDVRLRSSKYDYSARVSDFSAIDKFWELRARYTRPLAPEQVVAVRYTLRPTTLLTTQQSFNSHKIEAEIRSQWQPRWRTVFGSGWLRDLASNARSSSDLSNNTLFKFEAQYDINDRVSVAAKHITNPDLDNSIDSTSILQGDYSFSGQVSALLRYRTDKYKSGPNQDAYYAGLRFVPNNRFWSEFGLKQVSRGGYHSVDPLLSVVVHF